MQRLRPIFLSPPASCTFLCGATRLLHATSRALTTSPSSSLPADAPQGNLEPEGKTSQGSAEPAEDAFGEVDPLQAVEQALNKFRTSQSPSANDEGNTTRKKSEMEDRPSIKKTGSEIQKEKESMKHDKDSVIAEVIDHVASRRNQRRNRRKRDMDSILGDVLHDALRMRDMGEKPDADFVYKRTQERMYEEEYGHKPKTSKENASKTVPFPPDLYMHRLLPMRSSQEEEELAGLVSFAGEDATRHHAMTGSAVPSYCTKNFMNTFALLKPDPWPERAITRTNPVWTRAQQHEDHALTGGKGYAEWEARLYAPREGYDLTGEFLDAMDELAHWETEFLYFLRRVPLTQRRSLPFLHEWYRHYVHRLVRAERRYLCVRDAVMLTLKPSVAVYQASEATVERVRSFYSDAHRSLASPNYDPVRMKKSPLRPVMMLTDAEFEEWLEEQKQKRNELLEKL